MGLAATEARGLRVRRAGAAVLIGALLPGGVGPDAPAEASRARVAELARRAAADPRALAELRRIRSVDGVAFDGRAALAGARGDQLRARLRALARAGSAPRAAADPVAVARGILAGRRYSPVTLPRPLRAPIDALARALSPLVEAVTAVAARLGRLPGGSPLLWGALGAAVAATIAVAARRRPARRGRGSPSTATLAAPRATPGDLERRADAAEAAGDLEGAVRLRWRAGLARLEGAGGVRARRPWTSATVARAVGSAALLRSAATFDEIVYGGRPARPEDARDAREAWSAALREAGA
jgi:hypothetical protein